MDIFFITGNQGKLREAQELLPNIKGINLDLVPTGYATSVPQSNLSTVRDIHQ